MPLIRQIELEWFLRPLFLRPWGRRSDTLFAGPFAGEFGWELANWQGFVRKLSRRYRRTVVCCRAGNDALYADFASDIVHHNVRGTGVGMKVTDVRNPEELERVDRLVPPGADHLRPIGYHPFHRQELIVFGRKRPELAFDAVFHPRGRSFGADRNWSAAKWEELVARLAASGFRLACIGLASSTVPVRGDFADFRDRPLAETLDLLASSRLVLGPSSGPMHMASFCRTPHLVWTDKAIYAMGQTSRSKYEKHWNPFGTRAVVLDGEGFNPLVETVFGAARALLEEGMGRA